MATSGEMYDFANDVIQEAVLTTVPPPRSRWPTTGARPT